MPRAVHSRDCNCQLVQQNLVVSNTVRHFICIPLGSNNLDKMRLSPVRPPLTCLMWTSPFSVGSNCEWYDVQTTSSSYSWSSGLPTFGSTPNACQHSSSETAKNCDWNPLNLWSLILHGTSTYYSDYSMSFHIWILE